MGPGSICAQKARMQLIRRTTLSIPTAAISPITDYGTTTTLERATSHEEPRDGMDWYSGRDT